MGGIRNVEAKKKANHVVSSGAGGSSKGPSIIDKRAQLVNCPFCDKVYTQASSSRLKDHIATKHPPQPHPQPPSPASPPDPNGYNLLTTSGLSEGGAANGANRPGTASSTTGAGRQAPSLSVSGNASNGGRPVSAASSASSVVQSADFVKNSSIGNSNDAILQQLFCGSSNTTSAASAVGGIVSSGAAMGGSSTVAPSLIMDLDSKAGYYTHKSPKVHLLELSQREKLSRPRYSVRQQEDGKYSCKVVLPHPKRAEEDVVVFMDARWAVDDPSEAEQRAAVAALQHMAGDRQFHMLLPKPYVAMWHELGEVSNARKAGAAKHAASEAQRKQRDRERAIKTAARAPQVLVLSKEKQELLQQILRDRSRPTGDGVSIARGGGFWSPVPGVGFGGLGVCLQQLDPDQQALLEDLMGMGFVEGHVHAAIKAVCGTSTGTRERLLDFLLLHLPSSQLPRQFVAQGSLTNMVNRVVPQVGVPQMEEENEESAVDEVVSAQVAQLMAFGYQQIACQAALADCEGDDGRALALLYLGLVGSFAAGDAATAAEGGEAAGSAEELVAESWDHDVGFSDAWREEQMVMESIYGEEAVSYQPHRPWSTICLPLPESCPTLPRSNATGEPHCTLHIRCLGTAVAYPDMLPFLGVTCDSLRPAHLRLLTRGLSRAAHPLKGQPMAHDLATHLAEQLETLWPDDRSDDELPQITKDVTRTLSMSGVEGGEVEVEAEFSTLSEEFEGLGMVGAKEGGSENKQANQSGGSGESQAGGGRARRGGTAQSTSEAVAQGSRLQAHQHALDADPRHANMRRIRAALPAASKRAELLSSLAQHGVLVISGATGCGKSTQVPQFILEEAVAAGRGGSTSIIVTQPRRISALGLAARVAQERGEEVGDTVGYSVRLDTRAGPRTRILFVTTGVLMRRLLGDPSLAGITHVVLDEVHERSIEIDLLLLLLRDALNRGVSGAPPPLKLVLMSATADAALFADYMGYSKRGPHAQTKSCLSVGCATIPGFTHPVRELYLEDALELTGHLITRGSKCAKKGKQAAEEGAADDGLTSHSFETQRSMANVDETQVNYDLLAQLVTHVVMEQQQHGSAACMGGWSEGKAALAKVLPLHGSLSARDQAAVFARPPPGCFKIVLSTNVAETSVTIDDCTTVIDTGRAKEMQHDADRGILRLQEQWVSQAAAAQRRGRAGRVRPGVCFRLFSRKTWQSLSAHTAPEMLRSPLESVVLTIKGMAASVQGVLGDRQSKQGQGQQPGRSTGSTQVADVLSHCLSPPNPQAVSSAVGLLHAIGALDEEEVLTPLGHHLKQMPMDPRVGKMLVYSALLGCVDPLLTLAAAMAHGRPLFASVPPDQQYEVSVARRELHVAASAARSDHVALVAAYNSWARATTTGGRAEASALCARYALSESSLEAVAAGRSEYAGLLADLGFLPRDAAQLVGGRARGGRATGGSASAAWMSLPANVNATNARFLKAAVMAGFYPNVLRVKHPEATYVKGDGGTFEVDPEPSQVKFFDRTRGRTFIHPGSVNFSVGKFASGWMVYTQMTATTKLFVRESSMAPVYALLLFGGPLRVHHEAGLLTVDDWAEFKAPASVGVLVKELRSELSTVLADKICHPALEMSENQAVKAIMQLLSTDGF